MGRITFGIHTSSLLKSCYLKLSGSMSQGIFKLLFLDHHPWQELSYNLHLSMPGMGHMISIGIDTEANDSHKEINV